MKAFDYIKKLFAPPEVITPRLAVTDAINPEASVICSVCKSAAPLYLLPVRRVDDEGNAFLGCLNCGSVDLITNFAPVEPLPHEAPHQLYQCAACFMGHYYEELIRKNPPNSFACPHCHSTMLELVV